MSRLNAACYFLGKRLYITFIFSRFLCRLSLRSVLSKDSIKISFFPNLSIPLTVFISEPMRLEAALLDEAILFSKVRNRSLCHVVPFILFTENCYLFTSDNGHYRNEERKIWRIRAADGPLWGRGFPRFTAGISSGDWTSFFLFSG